MTRRLLTFSLIGCLFTITASHVSAAIRGASPSTDVAATASAWHSDPSLASSLGDELQIDDYTIRLPLGYHELPLSAPSLKEISQGTPMIVHLYKSPLLPSGAANVIMVMIINTPQSDTSSVVLDSALDAETQRLKQSWTGFFQTATDTGQFGGLSFERVYFEGWAPTAKGRRPMMGMTYAGYDGKNIVAIVAENCSIDGKKPLAIAEASILTFRGR